jgi:hypothetical protein
MLVPPPIANARGLPNMAAFRRRNPKLTPPLSVTVQDERDDRI